MGNGIFITFEGIEGSGKTTQIQLLNDYLRGKKIQAVLTREPGGTRIGDQVRQILLNQENKDMTSGCELFLYSASRSQHIKQVIEPSLKKGELVLCDRFCDATLAYQGYGRGVPFEMIDHLNQLATGGLKPALTFLFDLTPEEGLRRSKARLKKEGKEKREGRFEKEELAFHEKVRMGYQEIAKKEPERVVVIDASKNSGQVHREVVDRIEKKWNLKKYGTNW